MTKAALISLSNLLRLHFEKINANYQEAIPAMAKAAYVLFKLTMEASLLIVLEFFAVGKCTAFAIIRDVVKFVNIEIKNTISWPISNHLYFVMDEFCEFFGLPAIVRAIYGTYFDIHKPNINPEDYFYFKSKIISCNAKLWLIKAGNSLIFLVPCLKVQTIQGNFAIPCFIIEPQLRTSSF